MVIELQSYPTVWLGPWGTILLTIICAFFAILTGWSRYVESKVREKLKTWESTAQAAQIEMNIHKETCERLREENSLSEKTRALLVEQVAKLQAATDLKPLVDTVSSWVVEGRERFSKAEHRLDEIHSENTKALTAVLEEVKAQRVTSEDSYRQLTAAFVAHTQEDQMSFIENKETHFRFIGMMDSVERRLTEVAVRIGHPVWEQKQEEVLVGKKHGK